MITEKIISKIVDKIIIGYTPDEIILFGPYARNTAREGSDLDLIIVKDTNTPARKRGDEVRKILLEYKVPMDIKVYTPHEFQLGGNTTFSFLNPALDQAKILYERKQRNLVTMDN